MLNLYKRGRKFWARGTVRGQRIRRSLDTAFRDEALRRLREWERELWSGRRVRPLAWPDFQREFIAAVRPNVAPSTLKKYEYVAERFGESLQRGSLPGVQAVTTREVAAYLDQRRLGPEGAKSDQRILHRILAYAIQAGYLEKNPVVYRNLSSRSRNTQPFSQDEIRRMLEAADKITSPIPHATPPRADLRAILLTFLYTGLRISDVCGLQRGEVDLASRQIVRRTQKRHKVVAIPIHPILAAALFKHLESGTLNLKSCFVFPTSTGRMTRPETLDAMLRRLWKRAGIQGAHAHRFRDTFSVQLLRQRASLLEVAKLLGITVQVCEKHYAPWVADLQSQAARLVSAMPAPLHE